MRVNDVELGQVRERATVIDMSRKDWVLKLVLDLLLELDVSYIEIAYMNAVVEYEEMPPDVEGSILQSVDGCGKIASVRWFGPMRIN